MILIYLHLLNIYNIFPYLIRSIFPEISWYKFEPVSATANPYEIVRAEILQRRSLQRYQPFLRTTWKFFHLKSKVLILEACGTLL